jgi:hypothetical protein
MDKVNENYLTIGETVLSRRDTPQLAAGRIHYLYEKYPLLN